MSSRNSFVLCFALIATLAVSTEAYSWVSSAQGIPANAVYGGHNVNARYPLFVARGKLGSIGNILGYASPIENRAFLPFNEKAYVVTEWEYLVGDCFYWSRGYDGQVPRHAVETTESPNYTMFVGRQYINGNLIPGKIFPLHKVLYAAQNGIQVKVSTYEVLVSCENIF